MSTFLKLCFAGLMLHLQVFADVVLYSSTRCPYCVDVQNYLDSVGKKVDTKYIDKDPALRQELKEKGGKTQVPCLMIDGYAMYGSQDIIKWMKTHPERLQDKS
jgi:glutaredoxin 3